MSKKISMELGINDLIEITYSDKIVNSGEKKEIGIIDYGSDQESLLVHVFKYCKSMDEKEDSIKYGFITKIKPHYVEDIEVLHIPKCKERLVFDFNWSV